MDVLAMSHLLWLCNTSLWLLLQMQVQMKATKDQLSHDPELHTIATSNLLKKFLFVVKHCRAGPNVVKCIC